MIYANLSMVAGSVLWIFGYEFGAFPGSYDWIMAIQIGAPLIAVCLALCSPERFSVFHGSTFSGPGNQQASRHFCLVGVWAPTVCVLMSHGYSYVLLLPVALAVLYMGLAGTLVFVVGSIRDTWLRTKPGFLALLVALLLSLAWGYTTVLQLNCELDRSPAVVHKTIVSRKYGRRYGWIRYFRRRPTGWYQTSLLLEPWGPEREARWARVEGNSFFKSVEPGGTVCVALRAGALGLGWYDVQACPESGGRAAPTWGYRRGVR
jgi:hypothetical protein